MKRKRKKLTEADVRRHYPIAGHFPGWWFRIREISAGAWVVEGSDVWGRTVSRQGADPDSLLADCLAYLEAVQTAESSQSQDPATDV